MSSLAFAETPEEQINRSNAELYADQQEVANDLGNITQEICDNDAQLTLMKRALNRQKEITKLSGTQDLTTIHNITSRVVDLKEARQDAVNRYQNVTGKKLQGYTCD
jgi:hypothetical protein